MANGATNKAAGKLIKVSDSTVIRWKRHQIFVDLIEHYKPRSKVERALNAEAENYDLLKDARDAEILLTSELKEALEKIIGMLLERLDGMEQQEINDLAIRHLGPLMKVVSDGLGVLQNSHDRLTGYAQLCAELESVIEKNRPYVQSD